MDPNKRFRPSHDKYDVDRDGPDSGVNQVNPNDTPATRGTDGPGHQGGDPGEVRPHALQPNRDGQPDGKRDPGFDANTDRTKQRGNKLDKGK